MLAVEIKSTKHTKGTIMKLLKLIMGLLFVIINFTYAIETMQIPQLTPESNGSVEDIKAINLPGVLLFSSKQDGDWEIYSWDLVNDIQTKLTDNNSSDRYASWAPDGSKILYNSLLDDIYIMNKDGSEKTFVTTGRKPSFDFTGKAFYYEYSGTDNLLSGTIMKYDLETNTSKPVLADNYYTFHSPRCSKTKDYFVYEKKRSALGKTRVNVCWHGPNGTKQLTNYGSSGTYYCESPMFSPDLSMIVYVYTGNVQQLNHVTFNGYNTGWADHSHTLYTPIFSPDGEWVISQTEDKLLATKYPGIESYAFITDGSFQCSPNDWILSSDNLPKAMFDADPDSGDVPLTVQFTNQSTGLIDEYLWEFGDGFTSTDENPTYIYNEPGVYTVSLTASGLGGVNKVVKENLIKVESFYPIAGFSADKTVGTHPLSVQFSNQTKGTANQLLWDFGDGNSSTEQNPTHIYQENGRYSVSLTATNSNGSHTVTKENFILVTDRKPIGHNGIWIQQTLPAVAELNSISFVDKDNGWILGNNNGTCHIFSTVDGGSTWDIKYQGSEFGSASELVFTDKNNGWLLGDNPGYGSGSVYHSTDGGENWAKQQLPAEYINQIRFVDSKTGWAMGDCLFKTMNGGQTWSQMEISYDTSEWSLVYIFLLDANTGWVLLANRYEGSNLIFRTDNGGENWTECGWADYCGEVFFTDNQNGWLTEAFDGAIRQSIDGGESWDTINTSVSGNLGNLYFFYDHLCGFMTMDDAVYFTENGGYEWSQVNSIFNNSNACIDYVFPEQDNGFFISKNNVAKYCYKAPIAGFVSSTRSGENPLTVDFEYSENGAYENGPIDNYFWDFGDSTTSMEQNPTHIYKSVGTYDVTLTVTGPGGSDILQEEDFITVSHPSGIGENDNQIPTKFELQQNYPNPFNPSTNITFSIPNQSHVKISIYDINGKLVEKLVTHEMAAGNHQITWNAKNHPSGTYFIHFKADGFKQVKKCLLLK